MKTRGLFLSLLFLLTPLFIIYGQEPTATQISVTTNITGAEVYLNGLLMGNAPLLISPLEAGLWHLTVRKRGYYQEFRMFKIEEGEQKEYFINLIEITGSLIIENAPINAEFLYGEKTTQARQFLLPEGMHAITIRAFGYIERTIDIRILQNSDTILDGRLEKAVFEILNFKSPKKTFNPQSPSNLGQVEFSFHVSAPGTAFIEITNAENVVIRTLSLLPFSTWKQYSTWDGKDDSHNIVPDGKYSATLITNDNTKHSTEITVDSKIHYPLSTSMYGTSSTGPVELSQVLPRESVAVNFEVALTNFGLIPGISLLIGLPSHIEAGLRAGILINSEQKNENHISVSIKKALTRGMFSSALLTRFAYASGENPQSRSGIKNGIAGGFAAGVTVSPYAVHAELELINGNTYGIPSTKDFSIAGGLIGRVFIGPLAASVWTRCETGNIPSFFDNSATIMPGLSLYAIIPHTNLTLNIDLGYTFNKIDYGFFAYTGFGILL